MAIVKISEVCGLCAGCMYAINTAKHEFLSGKSVTLFKELVHNQNINSMLNSLGIKFEDDITKLNRNDMIIIRAHGEPPETYDYLNSNNFTYRDCTCHNVKTIHNLVKQHSDMGYKTIVIGKFHKSLHPEVFGTIGWAKNGAVIIETEDDISKLECYMNDKFYLVCQTTFNMKKADDLISKIEKKLLSNNCELIINKSICTAQKIINNYTSKLAKESDILIVVGGKNSSNTLELFSNISSLCPSVLIEDIHTYKEELIKLGIEITPATRIGITAGASTLREELQELKLMIEKNL